MTADLYQNVGGVPGPFVTSLVMTGEMDITSFSKSSPTGTGDFSAQLTSLDRGGSFVGPTGMRALDAGLDPSDMSPGMTSIDPVSSGPDLFRVISFFDVFIDLSVDGMPFALGAERVATLVETPEPRFYLPFVAFACIGLNHLSRRRRLAAR
jgi:hypothetical protein